MSYPRIDDTETTLRAPLLEHKRTALPEKEEKKDLPKEKPTLKASSAFFSPRSNHDDQAILATIEESLKEQLNHSIRNVKKSLGKSILSKQKNKFLAMQALKLREEVLGILNLNILEHWDHKQNADQRHAYFEKEIEKKKEILLKELQKNPNITVEVNVNELIPFLDKAINLVLKEFLPLEDYGIVNSKYTTQILNTEDFLGSLKKCKDKKDENEFTEVEKKEISKLNLKIITLNTLQRLLLNEPLNEKNFKELDNIKGFFTFKELWNYKDETHKNTALHICAWFDDFHSARVLIKSASKSKKPIENSKNKSGYLPFHFAIRKSKNGAAFLETLQPSRTDLTTPDPQHMQALEAAAFYGNYDALIWILATLKRPDKSGNIVEIDKSSLEKAFVFAKTLKHEKIVETLTKEIHQYPEWQKCFHSIIKSDAPEITRGFVKGSILSGFKDSDIDLLSPTELEIASKNFSTLALEVNSIGEKIAARRRALSEKVVEAKSSDHLDETVSSTGLTYRRKA